MMKYLRSKANYNIHNKLSFMSDLDLFERIDEEEIPVEILSYKQLKVLLDLKDQEIQYLKAVQQ